MSTSAPLPPLVTQQQAADISTMRAAIDAAKAAAVANRPGYRTTEFWLALVVVVGGALAANFANDSWAKCAGMIASALSTAGYGFARAMVKAAP